MRSACLRPQRSLLSCRNGRGYDVAKAQGFRFTHISPVWYQLRPLGGGVTLSGGHDVDQGWIADVRQPHAQVLMLLCAEELFLPYTVPARLPDTRWMSPKLQAHKIQLRVCWVLVSEQHMHAQKLLMCLFCILQS